MNETKKRLNKKQKNILIGVLLAVVLVMAVGYAAFSTQLNISNTAQIDSKWNVQITNITANKTATCSDSTDISTCTTTGNVAASYDNTNGLTATFSAALVSPGDSVTYTIEISNLGTLDAKLASIEPPTNTDDNITYFVNKDGSDTDIAGALTTNSILHKKDTSPDKGYVYVTVKYNSYSGQVTPTGNAATVDNTIKFNFVQSTSNAPAPAFTGTIYRNNSNVLYLNKPMTGNITIYYLSDYESAQEAYESENADYFWNQADCLAIAAEYELNCESGEVTVDPGAYETSNSDPSLGDVYLKHTIVNNIVTASYVCFTYVPNVGEICLQGGVDECLADEQSSQCTTNSNQRPVYSANELLLTGGVTTWFMNQPGIEGTCGASYNAVGGYSCSLPDKGLEVHTDGDVSVGFSSLGCSVDSWGESSCGETGPK